MAAATLAAAQTVFPANTSTTPRVLTVYSSLDEGVARPLIAEFQKQNIDVEIHYHDLQTLDIYERAINESDDEGATADLLLSSAMDLQVKLANDGYAQNMGNIAANWPS